LKFRLNPQYHNHEYRSPAHIIIRRWCDGAANHITIPMPHGHTRFESKGACIYCGATGGDLTDEHIVPFSLGGHHIINDASCLKCANITKKFEQDVARGLWGDARVSYNAPSRRKKSRDTHITLNDPHSRSDPLTVPYAEYPAPMIFYQMAKAGILQGLSETHDISRHWLLTAIVDQKKLDKFESSNPGRLTAKLRHVPHSFGRMIAKIGYGQALSILDLGDFNPICLPYILGHRENVSFIVGSGRQSETPDVGFGYRLTTAMVGSPERAFIVSEVRLIANNATPRYHVVVGDITGRANVERVFAKLGQGIVAPLDHLRTDEQVASWIPDNWPLPVVEVVSNSSR
jgi:hypothetical protein